MGHVWTNRSHNTLVRFPPPSPIFMCFIYKAAVDIPSSTLQPAMLSESSTANIGVPLDTVSCFIIEPANTPEESATFRVLPVGEVGELAIGGHQLARGYLNRPEQTASAFISTPYGRVYRSGDKARLTAAGTLECLGRLSSGQVKLRGQRIELGEIEQVILKTSGCHGAVAAVVDSNLVVFCAVDGDVTGDAIMANCEKWLPRFMVPSELVLKPEFPRLPSGKVDTKTLKSDLIATRTAVADAVNEENVSPEGRKVLRVVEETLGIRASQHMTLSSAGLDSLAAINLASSLRSAGFDTTAPELLKLRTISDLCLTPRLREKERRDHRRSCADVSLLEHLGNVVMLNPGLEGLESQVEDIVPCTSLQSSMLAETANNATAYCNEIELQPALGVSAEEIIAAFIEVANSNEILRTGFALWRGKHIAIVFRSFSALNVRVVAEFESGFDVGEPHALLNPLRAQVIPRTDTASTRLLLHVHHAVYDGWSMDMILSDMSMLLSGVSPQSRPQFREILRYQLGDHKKRCDDAARVFWSEHLLGWRKAPFPRLVHRASSSQAEICTQRLGIHAESIRKASQIMDVSNQVLFQAAIAIAWSGILGENDITLGSVTSGRAIPVDRIENIVGPCIASLPLRINLNNMVANAEILRSIHASNRAIMEHCSLSLSEIKQLAGLQPTEDLYDVLFVYQESPHSGVSGSSTIQQVSHLDRLETKLLIEVEPREDGYTVQATFHPSFIPMDAAEDLLQQLRGILRNLVHDNNGSLQAAKCLPDIRPSVFNPDPLVFQGNPDLAAGFEATAVRVPASDALLFSSSADKLSPQITAMSYRDLNEQANKIARFLQKSQACIGQVVAIIMNKCPLLYSSILAIVKAGCAYLPILPTTPISRVKEIFRQGRITHCVIDEPSFPVFASIRAIQFLNIDAVQLDSFTAQNLNLTPDPSRLAYVIYTSGTTGVPKGVAVTQKNIVSNIAHLNSKYPASPLGQARFLQACSQAFDVSVFEIFFAWHTGMCLCTATNDVLFTDLEHSIGQLDITHLSLTPTVASLIDPKKVPRVEFLVTAGEPMTLSVLDRWGEKLWQGYGPSETTNICSVKHMTRGEHIDHLGWTLPNTSVFVMRLSGLDPVPIGWVGELCFGGDQVAQGYLNDSRLTSDRFVSHTTFGRVYRSGDLGRMLPDGSLVILGRVDDQIKLRGQRIEAGEVNSVITGTHITEAATTILVRRRQVSSDQLASFYVACKDSVKFEPLSVDPEHNRVLFATLRSKVPSYMVPSYLIPVSQVPLTSSGKVDKRRLRACFEELTKEYIESASVTQDVKDEDGWSETEVAIAEVLVASNNVPRDDIGRWTPFAALGLDSVTTIEFSRALAQRFNSRISISEVLQNPSVAQLAKSINGVKRGEKISVRGKSDIILGQIVADIRRQSRPDPDNIEEIMLCTPLQEAMLSQGQGSYFNRILLRLNISADDMMSYWNEMSRRHGILRTCFITTRSTEHPIAQVVLHDWTNSWKTFDVHVPSLAGAVHEHMKCLPEPLDSGLPPLSFALIRYKGSIFLSVICHHALYDGVAMGNLWSEVEALANGRSLAPPVPYKPFIQQALSLPEDVDNFWESLLRGFRPSLLFSRLSGADINQCTHTTSLNIPLIEVQQQLKSIGTSLLSACQASWANVLAIACDHTDVAFGNVVSGRTLDLEGLERLVAPCFNTIPLRHDMSRSLQNIEVTRHFQNLNTQMIVYQFTSLRRIQRTVSSQRRNIFDTLLLLQQPLREMDESVWTLEEDAGNMDVPLVCEVVPCPNLNSVVINVHYDIDIVPGDVATTLSDIFKLAFRSLIDHPSARPLNRASLPPRLVACLQDLIPRKEKPGDTGQQLLVDEHWTSTETKVRGVISELSGVPLVKISRGTSIFQLGLDSINAVQVASMLRRIGFKVSASDVIECSTCEKLARKLSKPIGKSDSGFHFELQKFADDVAGDVRYKLPTMGTVEAVIPCTPVQSAMLASFTESHGYNYLNMLTYKVERTITIATLVEAWRELERAHPMLRTGFVPVNHQHSSYAMVRYLEMSLESRVEYVDIPFDLDGWRISSKTHITGNLHLPPWKVALAGSNSGVTMYILIHHSLYDAQSLDEILCGLAVIVSGRVYSFSNVDRAVAELLSQAQAEQDKTRAFWEGKAGTTVVNTFPVMTPLRETRGSVIYHERVSAMSFSSLRSATRRLGATVQSAIQASWTRVLSSYLGESSVVFGVTMSGRTTDNTQKTPLPCITTVPVVASNRQCNKDLIDSMMVYNTELHKHQFAPLGLIQKWLGHPATPVFDTLIVYQRGGGYDAFPRPWTLLKDEATAEYAVSLEIEPLKDDKCRICVTFKEDVLPMKQAQILAQQFDAVLQNMLQHPEETEDDLYKHCRDIFAVTPAVVPDMPAPVTYLHEFVENGALLYPKRTALEFVNGFVDGRSVRKTWNYEEFSIIGNRIANLLREWTELGDIVAIHFQKCPEAYFSILGILKAGCSFVALDSNAPKARKEFILQDSNAKLLLTSEDGTIDFEVPTTTLRIAEDSLRLYSDAMVELNGGLTPNSTCYCLYTSGTTGTPKGCEITHENAVQAMMAFKHLFWGHWDDESRWLQFASLHFDVSVLEQYWSWSVGITVVAAPRDLILDDLTVSINSLGITHIDLTPSLARLTHPEEMPSLCKGVFITGGESLNQEILDAWGSKAVIYNAYGPTEATIGVTMYQRVPINGRPSNIGKQFPNVGSYVFRPGTEIPVLRGGVGELCVSGKLVGKGYLNRPELTAERFPVLSDSGERLYRTGDLVRILHDGCFDFLGRADDQIKLRGQRLEIGEINHAIRTGATGVNDAATIAVRQDSTGKDTLVSFLVDDSDHSQNLRVLPDVDGLAAKARTACLERLPGYMVPTYFLRLPHIPLSPNNKVEAKELKLLFGSLSSEELIKLSAATATHEDSQLDLRVLGQITQILADFSRVPKEDLSASTSIFDIGVDSISALRLSAQLKSHGFRSASPMMVLRSPVVGDLVRALSAASTTKAHTDAVKLARQNVQACDHRFRHLVCRALGVSLDDIEYTAPCTPLQQGMISRAFTDELRGAYFNSFVFNIDSTTSTESVQEAWLRLVKAHAILRTTFVNTEDGHVQTALKNCNVSWQRRSIKSDGELTGVLQSTRESWISKNTHNILYPIQLIYVTGPTSRTFIVNIFHALYDGLSFQLMNEHAIALYKNETLEPRPSFLETLTRGPLFKYDDCRQFWIEHLQKWSFVPIQLSAPLLDKNENVSRTRIIEINEFEKLRARHNVTLQSVVLAIWASTLQRFIADKLTIGVIISGRSIDLLGADRVVGPLFNTVPFFNESLDGQTWASLIRRTHDFNTSILSFQHVPLKKIQRWCSNGRALFDNLFTFQIEQSNVGDNGAPWTVVDSPSWADYPLALEATKTRGGQLRLTLVSQGSDADGATLESLLDQFEQAVVTAQNDGPIDAQIVDDRASIGPHTTENSAADLDDVLFVWTDQARVLQMEIAVLAEVSPDNVDPSTSLLGLGLDSIDAIKLSNRLKKRDIRLSASQIMRHQIFERLVQHMEPINAATKGQTKESKVIHQLTSKLHSRVEAAGIDMNEVESVLPPTALQDSMVAGMLQSDFEWYFNHDVLEVAQDVDMGRLRDAWVNVINQSPILRTGFVEVEEPSLDMAYCQVVFRSRTTNMDFVELSDVSQLSRLTEEAKKAAIQGKANSNLFQITFSTIGERKFVVLSISHALYDGWSLSLLYQDLQAAYHGQYSKRPSPDAFMSFMLEPSTPEASEFWANYLNGLVPTIVKGTSDPDGPLEHQTFRRETASRRPLSDVMSFCKENALSLQVVCLACWAMVAAERTRHLDVVFGLVLSGRDFDGADDLLFPTMNTVALRCVLHGSVVGFLNYLEGTMTDIRDFQGFPLRKARAAAKITTTEMFNSLFLFQKTPNEGERAHTDEMLRSIKGSSAVDYPVCVEVEPTGDRLTWRVACQSQFFSEEDTKSLTEKLDSVLEYICRSATADVLSFHEREVSICGLPPVAIKDEATLIQGQAILGPESVEDLQDDTSLHIRRILSQVANVPEEAVQPSATLYHLGLDSISAIKISLLLRKQGIQLGPRDLVSALSIQQMTSLATANAHNLIPNAAPHATQWKPPRQLDVGSLLQKCGLSWSDVEAVLPATAMQVYMMTSWAKNDGSVFFPRFRYLLKCSALEAARVYKMWDTVMSQTPILRTRLIATRSRRLPWLQVIISTDALQSGRAAQPLVQFNVLSDVSPRGLILELNIHHALYDGVSLPAIMARLGRLLHGDTAQNSDGGYGMEQWSSYSCRPTLAEAQESRREFWTSYLRDVPRSSALGGHISSIASRTSYFSASAIPNISRLQALSARHGLSLQSLFFAAQAKVKADASTSPSVVVLGVYLANRTVEVGSPSAYYPTLNIVPLKVELRSGAADLLAVAKAIQEDIHIISRHGRADIGLWEIQEWTGIRVDSFVNFLSLPDEANGAGCDDAALMTAWQDEDNDVAATGFDSSKLLDEAWLQGNTVVDAFAVIRPLLPH